MIAIEDIKTDPWNFGLSLEQERRAAQLHQDCIIFDGMNQHPGGANLFKVLPQQEVAALRSVSRDYEGLGVAMYLPYQLAADGKSDLVRSWWKQSGVDVGTVTVATHPDIANSAIEARAREVLAKLDWIKPVTTAGQIRANHKKGIVSMWGYDQPLFGIPNRITCLKQAYQRGLRTLMLTYNRMDFVGAGCTERCDAGLSMYGLDVVRECNELGIIVDTSHCGRQTTLDACKASTTPVIANHSAAKGCYHHARGKTDEELEAIAKSGGLIGVVAVPAFLTDDPNANIEHMLNHIDYIAGKVGWRHVGIGTDWPLQVPADLLSQALGPMLSGIGFRAQDRISTGMLLKGFEDGRDFCNITRGLVARGYNDEQIAGILGENYLRVVGRVCG